MSKKKEASSTYGSINTGNTAIFVVDFYVNDNPSRIRVIISGSQVEEVGPKALTQWEQTLDCLMVAVSRCTQGEHEDQCVKYPSIFSTDVNVLNMKLVTPLQYFIDATSSPLCIRVSSTFGPFGPLVLLLLRGANPLVPFPICK